MNKSLHNLIEEMLPEKKTWTGEEHIATIGECKGYNRCIEDLKNRIPLLVDSVVEMIEEQRCKTYTAHYKNQVLDDIINSLKGK